MEDIRDILFENLTALMRDSTFCKTQNAAAKHAESKGLKNVKQTTLGTLLKPRNKRGPTYPKLNTIEAVAQLFGVTTGQLLTKGLGRASAAATNAVSEPTPTPYQHRDNLIQKTVAYMEASDPIGRAIVHDKAKDIAKEHPISKENVA